MDTHLHHQQQYFPSDLPPQVVQRGLDAQIAEAQAQQQQLMYQFGQQGSSSSSMEALLSMQGINENNGSQYPQQQLEQQFKLNQLQQLQQLQNQIFQQQIALISGGQSSNSVPDSPAPEPTRYHGLPTPGPSSELRAQPPPEFVSPMILHYIDSQQDQYPEHGMGGHQNQQRQQQQQHYAPRGSASAPAHIAFNNSAFAPDLDFDISPLTSPWLGPHNATSPSSAAAAMMPPPPPSTRQKRTASPNSADEPSRKTRQSPAIRPTVPVPRRTTRGTKSSTSTPLLRSTPRNSISSMGGDVPGDSPSPVDLSMPPPAAPAAAFGQRMDTSGGHSQQQHLLPVTPASIMNLNRLGLDSSDSPPASSKPVKGKVATRARSGTGAKAPKKNTESKNAELNGNAFDNPGGGGGPPRKTSHKAAEQKRRDSLKTTFDDLRGLLPPIPLPSDENFPDEPILPGALPPRGPPKAGGEGPNKGVSKLQLLRCGNDFIRQLKGRVERRDTEIDTLRREILRLRLGMGHGNLDEEGEGEGEEVIDLEKNLDAVEAFSVGLGKGGPMDEDEDEGDD